MLLYNYALFFEKIILNTYLYLFVVFGLSENYCCGILCANLKKMVSCAIKIELIINSFTK